MEIIDWISSWFSSNCDGDWEHENQIKIETVDNPGWYVTIDLKNTPLENLYISNDAIELSEDNWCFFGVDNKKFKASGDLTKLYVLLNKFKEIAERHTSL